MIWEYLHNVVLLFQWLKFTLQLKENWSNEELALNKKTTGCETHLKDWKSAMKIIKMYGLWREWNKLELGSWHGLIQYHLKQLSYVYVGTLRSHLANPDFYVHTGMYICQPCKTCVYSSKEEDSQTAPTRTPYAEEQCRGGQTAGCGGGGHAHPLEMADVPQCVVGTERIPSGHDTYPGGG